VSKTFALERDLLVDAALELQVDLEMCRYEYGNTTGYPSDPYDEFLYFAALVCFDPSIPEGSSHAGLTHAQIYLAGAWNYIDVARWLRDGRADHSGWTDEEIAVSAQQFERAARKLMDDAVAVPHCCLPCGAPKLELSRRFQ
jgi:hypothetical protein